MVVGVAVIELFYCAAHAARVVVEYLKIGFPILLVTLGSIHCSEAGCQSRPQGECTHFWTLDFKSGTSDIDKD